MDKLTKDALFLIAIELDLPSLLNFCASNSRINKLVCQRDDIWLYKLKAEYPDYKILNLHKTPKEIYTLFYSLTKLKKTLHITNNIFDIYQMKNLILHNLNISDLPKEIGLLSNLQKLDLSHNKIVNLPKEIGLLSNLQILDLNHNKIVNLPKEIGDLSDLKELNLGSNNIVNLPKEIGNLFNLQRLLLPHNNIKNLPKEIINLRNIEHADLSYNKIKDKNLPQKIGKARKLGLPVYWEVSDPDRIYK
jgi:hypothetical protein